MARLCVWSLVNDGYFIAKEYIHPAVLYGHFILLRGIKDNGSGYVVCNEIS